MKINIFLFCCLICQRSVGDMLEAKGRVTISTDDQASVEGTKIHIFFNHGDLDVFLNSKSWYTPKEYILDKDGIAKFDESSNDFSASFKIDGYWPASFNISNAPILNERNEWIPRLWDIRVLLRRKMKPRPLYVKSESLMLTELNHRYGYDMERGALVRPYGIGVQSDMYFTMTGEVDRETGEFDIKLTVSFPSEGDGIISVPAVNPPFVEQSLLLGQEAPENGFQPQLSIRTFMKQVDGRWKGAQEPSLFELQSIEGLWFRTHTIKNAQTGEFVRARHGKIFHEYDGAFRFNFSKDPRDNVYSGDLSFTYFYAPDESRSLEFNQQNLLPWREGFFPGYFPRTKH